VAVLELHPFNRPDLTFRIDAADARLLAKCKRWHAVKKLKSLTFYVQGCNGAAEPTVYLHRLIMDAPEEMTVSSSNDVGKSPSAWSDRRSAI
jgi:hypothetical protein